jgi:sugar lactone lactonase YvrE
MPGADRLERVAAGFSFAEGPRWHKGAVYLSHIHDDAVERVEPDGTVTRVADLPGSPISIGFTSDGTLLVSALDAGRIWRVSDNGIVDDFRDVSSLASDDFGDIVIDTQDRIYLANQGMSYPSRIPETIDSPIFLLTPGGDAREVARGFNYANGMAITPDGRLLVVAESFGHRLFVLDIEDDGSLGPRRQIAQFDDVARPDGICCDAEGAVWTANATSREVLRCTLDGTITHRISTGDALAIGCILGGPDGHDLYVTTATTALREEARASRESALWHTRAAVPAGGRP